MTPQQFAEKMFTIIRGQIRPGMFVPLVEYDSQMDCEECTSDERQQISLLEQRERNTEIARLIVAAGAEPVFVQLVPCEYFGWLGDRENNSANRAAFAGWKVAGEPENYNTLGGVEPV